MAHIQSPKYKKLDNKLSPFLNNIFQHFFLFFVLFLFLLLSCILFLPIFWVPFFFFLWGGAAEYELSNHQKRLAQLHEKRKKETIL